MMVSSGTLWAVKSTAYSLTSQPSSAAAARLLMALTKPRLAYQPSSSGTFSAPAASSAARYLSLVRREENGLSGSATTSWPSSSARHSATVGSVYRKPWRTRIGKASSWTRRACRASAWRAVMSGSGEAPPMSS